ncbi:hypothetical protein [uncultured Cardiobacterium sp.]|uniref:hypothetical protein n=1 Tax=uncultured Cardiobacterium sp. TaxID=417619 RepID=UPI0026044759|nr:hypothetical protein [uncultured Cardiobacterium sp.]
MKTRNQIALNWLDNEGLYKESLLIYLAIICFWIVLGYYTLGFEISIYSLQQNLLLNFFYFLLLCAAVLLTPFWYSLFFINAATNKKLKNKILLAVCQIENKELAMSVKEYLINKGELLRRKYQKIALYFLGCYFLFEIFYISAWVKNFQLIWEPSLVKSIVAWMIDNTSLSSEKTRSIKLFSISLNRTVVSGLVTEREFLFSKAGDSVLLFNFFRTLFFVPMLASFSILLWDFFDAAGLEALKLYNANSVKALLWSLTATLVMSFVLIGGLLSLVNSIDFKLNMVYKGAWPYELWVNLGFVSIIVGVKFIISWLFYFKKALSKRSK